MSRSEYQQRVNQMLHDRAQYSAGADTDQMFVSRYLNPAGMNAGMNAGLHAGINAGAYDDSMFGNGLNCDHRYKPRTKMVNGKRVCKKKKVPKKTKKAAKKTKKTAKKTKNPKKVKTGKKEAKNSRWITFVKKYQKDHGISYKEALSEASDLYRLKYKAAEATSQYRNARVFR